jgi:hypothetical protein
MWEWRFSSTILDLGTRWKWVVSFMPRPLYLQGNSSPCPLDRRLRGPKNRSGRCGVGKKICCSCRELNPARSARKPIALLYRTLRKSLKLTVPLTELQIYVSFYLDLELRESNSEKSTWMEHTLIKERQFANGVSLITPTEYTAHLVYLINEIFS